MNEFEPHKRSLHEMFTCQRYRLDYYQREYAWTDEEINDLAEDLLSRFSQEYGKYGDDVKLYSGYFLGSIITCNDKASGRLAIIDGQQRLTTITLLLIYLKRRRDASPLYKTKERDLEKYIFSKKYSSERESYVVDAQGREHIIQAFRQTEKIPSADGEKPAIKNLVSRYADIKREFDRQTLSDEKLDLFLDWVLHNIFVIEITTISNDDAYEIFTTVNDRGLGLTDAEMLKGFVLSKIEDDGDRDRLKSKWEETIDVIHRIASGKGNLLKIIQKEEGSFFQAWIRGRYGNSNEDFMLIGSGFHRWIEKANEREEVEVNLQNYNSVKMFVEKDMRNYASFYEDIRRYAKKYDSKYSHFYFNNEAHFTLQLPLVLAAATNEDSREMAMEKMLMVAKYIEIVLARRMWAMLPISQRVMLPIVVGDIIKIRQCKDDDELRAKLHELLEEEIKDRKKAPLFSSDSDIRLHGNNKPTIKRLLARITEWVQAKAHGDPLSFEELMRRSYEIEHLWGTNDVQCRSLFDDEAEYRRERNRIGALVLIKEPTNKHLGGRRYEEKLNAYSMENLLAASLSQNIYQTAPRLKRFIKDNDIEMKSVKSFGKKDLENRTELYVHLAKLCWSPEFD